MNIAMQIFLTSLALLFTLVQFIKSCPPESEEGEVIAGVAVVGLYMCAVVSFLWGVWL